MTTQPEFAACTIIAKNYLPMARVLARSWNAHHPAYAFYVLVLDSPAGFFNPEAEPFHSVSVEEIGIPNLKGFLFKYTILEASTAVKPYLLDHLFQEHSIQKLLYLDPDILILRPLTNLKKYLETSSILLTPHLLSPLPNDGHKQTDHDILQAGTYNLGFIGLRNDATSRQLLGWWSEKVYHHCLVGFENNLFVDQRWMDLVPGLFDGVYIIREPGYNMAYWNLHERRVALDDEVWVNGQPLYFFHFSGFNPGKPWIVSKHQDRFQMGNIGETRKLYAKYHRLLIENGWNEVKDWNYGHDFFRNGLKIPDSARRYYWSLGPDVAHLGDPFTWLDSDHTPDTRTRDFERLEPGVNLVGYFEAEKGVGEGARSNLRIIQAAGIPFTVNNWVDPGSDNIERPQVLPGEENPYLVNLITINADQFVRFSTERPSYMKGHFNIGYWAWELPEFPPEWRSAFGFADEIWTPSKFTRDSVASCAPVPVRVVPHSLDPSADFVEPDRASFGIDPAAFVFLFVFDFHSYLERKNPFGLLEAFRKAFGSRRDVQLVLKSSRGKAHPEQLNELRKASQGSNVIILDRVLPRLLKQQLMQAADCYVSLHRSEGFGLTLAEEMSYGKPVIATAYSGNVDFMSAEDSYLVPYKLITISQTHGPYKKGYHWADPDLDSAADLMRYVERNRDAAAVTGLKAKEKIWKLLHPASVSVGVRNRLQELGLLETAFCEAGASSRQ